MALEKAAQALADKLQEIEEHPSFQSVWTIAAVHGCPYTGPNYSIELKALRSELDELR
jgi:hypothetical protein